MSGIGDALESCDASGGSGSDSDGGGALESCGTLGGSGSESNGGGALESCSSPDDRESDDTSATRDWVPDPCARRGRR